MSESEQITGQCPYRPQPWEAGILQAISSVYGVDPAVEMHNRLVIAKADTVNDNTIKAKTIQRGAVYKRMREYPEFAVQVEGAREVYLDKLEALLMRESTTNGALALKILERLRPDKWGPPQQKVELAGNPDKPLNVNWNFVRPNDDQPSTDD